VEMVGYEARVGSAGSGMAARLFEVRQDIRKFVSITALMGLITAVADVILLVILGVDFPLMWGVFSFLFNLWGSDSPKLASLAWSRYCRSYERIYSSEPQCFRPDVPSGLSGQVSTRRV